MMHGETRFQTEAPLLARSALARLTAPGSEPFAETSGDFGENWPGYRWELSVSDLVLETLGTSTEDLKRVELTVSLDEGDRRYRLVTYRFRRP